MVQLTAREQKILNNVNYPSDIRNLTIAELKILAEEIRQDLIEKIAKTGGHLGAGLGVVELTIALHYVFNTPKDLLVWDIGHQAYPHKYLTGRKAKIETIRQKDGISGFLKRSESEYDVFGAGHCSTSISAALGLAAARDIKGEDHEVIAVIGDGALSAGMAYEAMNNASELKSRIIVILNDNKMSIAPAVGAMSKYLNRLISSQSYLSVRHFAKNLLHLMPNAIEKFAKKTKKYAKDLAQGGNLFEELGFHYIGPIDGHDLDQLIPILRNIRSANSISGPILIHTITEKGRGFSSPDGCGESYHAVSKYDPITKEFSKNINQKKTYTQVFAETLTNIAASDPDIVAITAAMPSGTGLNIFAKKFPERMYDVGIAEQHAVTFSGGLSLNGIKPFVAIYSTFLQRAYDQVVHDVALQSLPVRFAVDRAGLVGADGPTHAGIFDITYLASLPNFIVMAASDELELARMVITAHTINDKPSAFRFPRGEGEGIDIPVNIEPLPIGKAKMVKQGGNSIAIISLGCRLKEVMKADVILQKQHNINITIVDARFAKPLDENLILELATSHKGIITIEEGSIGGFAAAVGNLLHESGYLDKGIKLRSMFIPDVIIEQAVAQDMYKKAGLNAKSIVEKVLNIVS